MPVLRGGIRRRYYLAISVGYLIVGAIIVVRSVQGHVIPIGLLGLVFMGLGVVRLRDYLNWRRSPNGS